MWHVISTLHALQAYGDAVLDEAPIFFLTNYQVTVFLKRSADVMDKRIWASDPIWFDQTNPPARACWVHGLRLAEQMEPLKRNLPRAVVPPTLEGYLIQLRPQQAHHSDNQAAHADSVSARRVRRRIMPTVNVRLRACSASGKGDEPACEGLPAAAEQTASTADAVGVKNPATEDVVTVSELHLSDELLGAGQFGFTLRVSITGSYNINWVAEAPAFGMLHLYLSKLWSVAASCML